MKFLSPVIFLTLKRTMGNDGDDFSTHIIQEI